MSESAPIVLFCYSRPVHLRKSIDALANNRMAGESDLIVFSDAPATPGHFEKVAEVRELIDNISGFRSVTINERPFNYGLSRSIIEGVNQVLGQRDRVIVLEDDMVTSPHFLDYMNEALERFSDQDRVACIHGYVYPVKQRLPEAFFLPGADCWGWATWRRAWDIFNSDGSKLLHELISRDLIGYFDYNNSYHYSRMLKDQIRGNNDSWAVRWYASALLADKLTLYPGRSLVHNIGNDRSGIHCEDSPVHDTEVSTSPICLDNLSVEENIIARASFEEYFRGSRRSIRKKFMHNLSGIMAAPRKFWT